MMKRIPHGNTKMKTNFQKSNATRQSKSLFVMSLFGTESFPVPVRHLQSDQAKASKTSVGAGSLERREIPQLQPQGKMYLIDLVPTPVHNPRRVSTSL
jgi:hypothetical protein